MTREQFEGLVKDRFRKRFPEFKVQVESLEGDDRHLGFSVFGVENLVLSEVQDFVLDIDCELGVENGFVVTPLIKSLEVTQSYYPKLLPDQPFHVIKQLGENESAVFEGVQSVLSICQLSAEWNGIPQQSFENDSLSRACNEELALAA